MSLRILGDGRAQCYVPATDDARVYHELAPVQPDFLSVLQTMTASLAGKPMTGSIDCFDEVRQYYDTGHFDGTFLALSLAPECGSERIEDPAGRYLEGFLDALYLQCPAPPGPSPSS